MIMSDREVRMNSILPLSLVDVAKLTEDSLPDGCASDDNHFDRPKGEEWLNKVLESYVNSLESGLLETGRFNFGPPLGILSSQPGWVK